MLFIIQQHWSHSTPLHSCFMWNGMLLQCWTIQKICFSRQCKTWRWGTLLSSTVIVWKSIFRRLVRPIKYEIFYGSINGNNSKMDFTIFCCASETTTGDDVALSVQEEWLQSRSRTPVKGLWFLYVGYHKYSRLKREKTTVQLVSIHQYSAWREMSPSFYQWN